jgi:mono/diheme cytochrome c family protein
MPPLSFLTDEEAAAALTYVRRSWGNAGDAVTPSEVAKKRPSASLAVR